MRPRERERGTPPPVSTDLRRVCERMLANPRAGAVRYAVQAATALRMEGGTRPRPQTRGWEQHPLCGERTDKPPRPWATYQPPAQGTGRGGEGAIHNSHHTHLYDT